MQLYQINSYSSTAVIKLFDFRGGKSAGVDADVVEGATIILCTISKSFTYLGNTIGKCLCIISAT